MRRSDLGGVAVLLAVIACRNPAPPQPPSPTVIVPAGRSAPPLYCPDGHPAREVAAACAPTQVGIAPPPPPPEHFERSAPVFLETPEHRCLKDRVSLCGLALDGPRGSLARYCRAPGSEEPNGVAQFVAPDGSVLVEGVCLQGAAQGAWLWWSGERLQRAVAIHKRNATGLDLEWDGRGYRSSPSLEVPED